jgi:hypothetical protein
MRDRESLPPRNPGASTDSVHQPEALVDPSRIVAEIPAASYRPPADDIMTSCMQTGQSKGRQAAYHNDLDVPPHPSEQQMGSATATSDQAHIVYEFSLPPLGLGAGSLNEGILDDFMDGGSFI